MNLYTPLVTDLLGTKLRTPQDEEIGVVQNVMLNPSSGIIIFIFLCYGNFMGKTHRHFAIPRKAMSFISDKEYSYFEIDERRLKQASVKDGDQPLYKIELVHIYELPDKEEIYETQFAV